jgi:hypothetical protein
MIFHSSQVVFRESFSVSITINRRKKALFLVESSEWDNLSVDIKSSSNEHEHCFGNFAQLTI